MKLNIIFHSLYGHVWHLAESIAEGAKDIPRTDVGIYQVEETLSDDILTKMNALEAKKSFAHIPTATLENLSEADALIFGTPTRFGMMSAQMRAFLDATGGLWMQGELIGKVGSVFASTGTQHGGQETTIRSFHTSLLHHGMIIVGCPYSEQRLLTMDEISGGTPYGATTMAGGDGSRTPTENEILIARFQGKHVAKIATKLTS